MTHTGDSLEEPSFGEQGTLHCSTTGPLLGRAGDTAHLPNTEKQTRRVGQNEETEEYDPSERLLSKSHSKMAKLNRVKQFT